MSSEKRQLVRLLLVCAAWAAGEVLAIGLGSPGFAAVVAGLFAVGVYVITDDLGRSGRSGGDGKYWRGRRIDRIDRIDQDRPKRGRWN